jgi:tetratricopeptide (TPR) repeat protein
LQALGILSYLTQNYRQAADSLTEAATAYYDLGQWRAASQANHDASASYYELGQYEPALTHAREALAIDEDHPSSRQARADLLGTAAATLALMGDHDGARQDFERALDVLGSPSPETASMRSKLLHNQAILEDRLGHYDKAERLLNDVLEMTAYLPPGQRSNAVNTLNTLGVTYRHLGKDAQAEATYRRAIAESEASSSRNDPNLGVSLHNLAALLIDRQAYDEADTLLERSIRLLESSSDVPTDGLAVAINSLGVLRQRRGELTAAKKEYQRSLDLLAHTSGPTSSEYADVLSDFSSCLEEEGDLQGAEDKARHADHIRRDLFGETHPKVAASWYRIGQIRERQGDLIAAEEAYRQSAGISSQFPSPRKVTYLEGLIRLLRAEGRHAEASKFENALQDARKG